MVTLDKKEWNEFLRNFDSPHILQTSNWGELKSHFGWYPVWVGNEQVGAQILFRKLPLDHTIAYIPKGPLGENWEEFIPEIDAVCQENKAVFLKIEMDSWEIDGIDLSEHGFIRSGHEIQPRRTISIDISGSEEDILAQMKQKTRYNIRLAGKKGVIVERSDDIFEFSDLMDITGKRDEFGVHTAEYYQKVFDLFKPDGLCELLIAKVEGKPAAGVIVFASGKRAWYFYGASSNEYRNLMPTYLVQWEAIRWAKAKGCLEYDFWGVPDADQMTLEEKFMSRKDGLWGVYRFKRGFGGEIKRSAPAWDKVYKPLLYKLYMLRMGGGNSADG